MKITTDTGFTCEIDKSIFDDFRTLSAMGKMFDDSRESTQRMAAASRIIELVLGKDESRLMEHCTKDGHCSPEDVFAELNDIMAKVSEDSEAKKE